MLTNSSLESSVVDSAETRKNKTKPCVNCQKSSFTKLFDGYDFDTGKIHFAVESCDNCHLTRTSPALDQAELSEYYDTKYYGSSKQKFNSLIESWTIWSNNRLAHKILNIAKSSWKEIKKNPKILDIGCGRANLLKAFQRSGCECYGVERSDFPDDNQLDQLTIYKQDFLNVTFEHNSFDIIVIWHVLEHLANPSETIKKAQKILKPDGTLIIAVPNFSSLQRAIFQKHWFHLDMPRHTYHFDHLSINSILTNSGLHTKSSSTLCFDQSLFGFVQSTINSLEINPPNTLYSILKNTQKRPGTWNIAMQFLLASMLLPVAFLEYLISGLTGRGACLTIQSAKYPASDSDQQK